MGERRTFKRLVMSNLSRTIAYDALLCSHHTMEVVVSFKIKRATEPLTKADGARILIDRLWPRGQSKDKLQLTAW
ncbi:MAG: DUF488 family protein, partial [Xanthomonadaceae bacterium]|nr:DUF488 family protein [Xanthomonadaceae bacterium]